MFWNTDLTVQRTPLSKKAKKLLLLPKLPNDFETTEIIAHITPSVKKPEIDFSYRNRTLILKLMILKDRLTDVYDFARFLSVF